MTRRIELSEALFAEACNLLPGGVSSPVRAFRAVGGTPFFVERGEGAYLVDVDGNRYIDYVLSWGPLILGHAHPRVVAALEEHPGLALAGAAYGGVGVPDCIRSGEEAAQSLARSFAPVSG